MPGLVFLRVPPAFALEKTSMRNRRAEHVGREEKYL